MEIHSGGEEMKRVVLDGDYICIRVRNDPGKAASEGYVRERMFVRDPHGENFKGWIELPRQERYTPGDPCMLPSMVCRKCGIREFMCIHVVDDDYSLVKSGTPGEVV